jgi:hypothetical protein
MTSWAMAASAASAAAPPGVARRGTVAVAALSAASASWCAIALRLEKAADAAAASPWVLDSRSGWRWHSPRRGHWQWPAGRLRTGPSLAEHYY